MPVGWEAGKVTGQASRRRLAQEVFPVLARCCEIRPDVHPALLPRCCLQEIMPRGELFGIARKDGFWAVRRYRWTPGVPLSGRRVYQAALAGDAGGFGAVLGAQLGEDGPHVKLDGALGDVELAGDLGVLEAAG